MALSDPVIMEINAALKCFLFKHVKFTLKTV